ncbi:MAG: alpha/beta hydrolase [Phycisphaerae bacterium]
MESTRVVFPGAGKHELVGRWEVPSAGPMRWAAVYASCFTCIKDLKGARRICRQLTDHGFGILRFDYMGLGESKGDFAESTFTTFVGDIVAAAGFITREFAAPQLLIGHSIGGSASLVAEQSVPSTRLIATVNSPVVTHHLGEMILREFPTLGASGPKEMSFAGGRPVRVSQALADSLIEADVERALPGIQADLLVFQATQDSMLGTRHAERIFQGAKSPKSFIQLPEADHLLIEREQDAQFIANVIGAYANSHWST